MTTPNASMTVDRGGEQYVVEQSGDSLRVGHHLDGQVEWSDAEVPLAELGGEARRAWEQGDTTNSALVIAVDGIISAAANRGG